MCTHVHSKAWWHLMTVQVKIMLFLQYRTLYCNTTCPDSKVLGQVVIWLTGPLSTLSAVNFKNFRRLLRRDVDQISKGYDSVMFTLLPTWIEDPKTSPTAETKLLGAMQTLSIPVRVICVQQLRGWRFCSSILSCIQDIEEVNEWEGLWIQGGMMKFESGKMQKDTYMRYVYMHVKCTDTVHMY